MDQKMRSQQFLRHRKFMLALPVLALPFIALLFWSFGGGRGSTPNAFEIAVSKGLNTQLPDAVIRNDQSLTKLSSYDKATSDSLKRVELLKTDPFFKAVSPQVGDTPLVSHANSSPDAFLAGAYSSELAYNLTATRDPNEAKVYSKIDALNKAMSQASARTASQSSSDATDYQRLSEGALKTGDIDRLEQMMNVMKSSGGEPDPEMKQLSGMLDKIIDIQHPQRVGEALRQTANVQDGKVVAVSSLAQQSNISLLQKPAETRLNRIYKKDTTLPMQQNGFYSLDTPVLFNESQNAITAVIHETLSLVSGATVKMRLLNDITVAGGLIPKGNFVYGTASITDERLKIAIQSIRYQNSIFPVKLSVYDMDGMEGIFVPGSITRDVAKASTDQALQGINLPSLSPSLPLQAAGAGIQAAKTLLSKKAKLIKVSVKAGYQVLLKESD